MTVVEGEVSRVRHSADVWGNENQSGVVQVVSFQIGRQAVELSLPKLPQIEDGDEIVVAGDMKEGTLVGLAYKNRSNNTYGKRPGSVARGCGMMMFFFVLFGVGALIVPPVMLGAFVGLAQIPSILAAMRSNRALRLVRA